MRSLQQIYPSLTREAGVRGDSTLQTSAWILRLLCQWQIPTPLLIMEPGILWREQPIDSKSSIFFQSIAIAAISYLLFRFLYWLLYWLAAGLSSLSNWLKWRLVPWSEEAAVALGLIYLVVALMLSSRDN